ncbi:unnamed protein product [Candida verbasci]|uniref:ICE2-domain-containing protein n=1 Tax=Candida verbasci TaxID=1227364 RepID=A0A9W4TUT9_9ASCO|nr:unnamed protein product [Candida verbasci]
MPPVIIFRIFRFVRGLFSSLYLILTILTIPLAFDVGGVNCGLAFSLTTLFIYFILTTIRILFRRTKYFKWVSLIYYCQHFFIPSLLTYFLSLSQNNFNGGFLINGWNFILINSTPFFTILEGFCSLLLIQAIGQTISWLTIYKSDSWLIISLIGSGSVITGAFYFLYRIYVFPFTIEMIDASLLGSLLTMTIGLSLFGIISGKGSIIESSLLFAYIVRCIYETFPILSEGASQSLANLLTLTTINLKKDLPKIPPSILNPISEVVPFLTLNLPQSFKGIWEFLIMSIKNLTLPLILNLAYRIGVFYAATKIIPSLYQSSSTTSYTSSPPKTPQLRSRQSSSTSLKTTKQQTSTTSLNKINDDKTNLSQDHHHQPKESQIISSHPNLNKFRLKPPHHQPPSAIIRLIYAYSPCLIIAVYTHLMLSYIGELGTELKIWPLINSNGNNNGVEIIVHPWKFWNWINMVTTLVLYAAELSGNESSSNGGNSLTSHWKIEN